MASSLQNAVVRLLRERPFYGQFLLNLRREERPLEGKPAGVTIRTIRGLGYVINSVPA